ncbi:MAG: adventurous gliding motility lipoprotein CglB [Archangium sp.]|nr:adventurous gliding motility lipoprotein CglB [Archangium sp.]
MMRSFGLLSVLVLVASCQTYDFERVTPLAVGQTTDKTIVASKRLKPNVMLLVDNSGSMLLPTNTANPNCPANCGNSASNPCPGTCPTRVSEMKSAMATFLQSSGAIARLGVTIYPTDNVCKAASNIDVAFPTPTVTDDGTDSALTANASQVNTRIQMLGPTGGTPTGPSLEFLGTYGGLTDNNDFRDDFVLLLTDGLPNCNDNNPNQLCSCGAMCTAMQTMACNCTTSTCASTLCAKGCLDFVSGDDNAGAVGAVKALRQKGIRTIVVGFGADLAGGTGPTVLNAMARAGGFARECQMGMDSECGTGNTCNQATKVCSQAFFQAANGAELAAALQKISQSFQGDPCVFTLSARPSDPRYLSVVIDGNNVQEGSGTFSYDFGTNKVTFLGDLCTRLTRSTTQNPVNVEFRIVERF